MKASLGLSFLCTVVPGSIAAQTLSSTDVVIDLVKALPECVTSCLTTALESSACSPTDQQCICTNVPLQKEVEECAVTHCTVKELLTSKNVTSIACNQPIRDQRHSYNWSSNSFAIASWVAFLLRIASRLTSDARFWWDDLMATAVMLVGIPSAIINVEGLTRNGLGKDIWTLSFENISRMIRFFYVSELLYFAQISFVKISILLFFLRLFPERKIRWTIWGTIIMNVVILILFDLLAAFSCRPISFYWKGWDGEHVGRCLNINALAFTSAGASIVMDFWILMLPLTQLYDLNLHWKRKVGVVAMLSIGIVVTVVSILRLRSLVHFSNTKNPTWDYIQVGYWSTIEICTSIICSCMPALRLLLVRVFPRLSGTSSNPSDTWRSFGDDPSKRISSVPNVHSRDSYARRDSYAGPAGITMHKTFEVVSTHRGMGSAEEDGTELVTRPGTNGLEQKPSHDISSAHATSDLGQKSSAWSLSEGELVSPRCPSWV
ncbi:hypothetical protein DSL72_002195 [Monilinia vaccinii-corymbosi]|uniref:CFEM domain-containing protein n=1 Tax=Monilinia vaccinii-corymbosi TaxID=61207 RepID=A0A8A3PBX1_9HELO|nr:hypothetical protein DSL72_002195 [Monilinia vaccinii-corymbosi]